jgi:hypothetical protein
MNARGKELKRKRGPLTFGELVQKLWQLESEGLEPKVAKAKHKKSTGKASACRVPGRPSEIHVTETGRVTPLFRGVVR